jgi:oxygen-independent coproporphyrinogen III oxidase
LSRETSDTEERGLYVHIPFCVSKCSYCDFYSLPGRLGSLDNYLQALLIEAAKYRGGFFTTLYLGGGTPSLLQDRGLKNLLANLRSVFNLAGLREATLEANPESLTGPLLETALSAGINRLSIGVQSLSDLELQRAGRVHNALQAVQAVEMGRKYGFKNISVDVILGLPGQDWSSLQKTLEMLVDLALPHLSVYCLTVEPHTPLANNPPSDLPDEDTQADLYLKTTGLLIEAGFHQYEISNFALPGYACLHNLNYWRGGEYLGLGPSAASHLECNRFKNRPDLDAYLLNPAGQQIELERLPPSRKAGEEAVTRLRLLEEGLDLRALEQKFGASNIKVLKEELYRLAADGWLIREDRRFRLPGQYALVSNSILSRMIAD